MAKSDKSWLTRFKESESSTSVIFGAIVVIVVGILLFNYSRSNPSISEQGEATESATITSPTGMQLPATYTVVSGDTLWAIAAKYYGDGNRWVDLIKENGITSTGQVEVGQELRIPVLADRAPTTSVIEPVAQLLPSPAPVLTAKPVETKNHTVVAGDCLWDIAVAVYNDGYRWTDIYQANKTAIADPDLIYPGQILVLP